MRGAMSVLVRGMYSEEFAVIVSFHQGSETLSREFRSGFPWEDLYADDLVIITESLEELCQEALVCLC